MSSHVLSDRDVNTASVSGMPTDANGKASGAQAHRNALQSRMGEDKYVKPRTHGTAVLISAFLNPLPQPCSVLITPRFQSLV